MSLGKFPNQHQGQNMQIVPVLLFEKNDQREVDMFRLMHHIDMIDRIEDFDPSFIDVDAFYMSRPTYDFYMKWLAQGWYVDGTTVSPEIVVKSMSMFCVMNRVNYAQDRRAK